MEAFENELVGSLMAGKGGFPPLEVLTVPNSLISETHEQFYVLVDL